MAPNGFYLFVISVRIKAQIVVTELKYLKLVDR